MSFRPRRAATQATALPANVRRGLSSFCTGNDAIISAMLGGEATGRSDSTVVDKLAQVMAVNSLSAEQMLARFFDASVLAEYCERLGKSSNGPAATLAARIAKEWAQPDFAAEAADEGSPASSGKQPATAWKQPTWLELQSDSDDDEDEANRKRLLRAELRKAKQQQQQQQQQPSAANSEPKRRKLDAAETASALSQAAYEGAGADKEEE